MIYIRWKIWVHLVKFRVYIYFYTFLLFIFVCCLLFLHPSLKSCSSITSFLTFFIMLSKWHKKSIVIVILTQRLYIINSEICKNKMLWLKLLFVYNANKIASVNIFYKVLSFCMCWCLPFLIFRSPDHNLYSEKQVGVGTLTSASFFALQYILFNQSNQFENFQITLFEIISNKKFNQSMRYNGE